MAAIPPAESKFFFLRGRSGSTSNNVTSFFFLPNRYHVDMIGLDLTQLSALTKKKCG